MRYVHVAIVATFLSISPGIVYAEERVGEEPVPTAAASQPLSIVEDQDAKAFRFMIDGKEVARIDADGLYVRQNINYGGYLLDYGSSGFDEPVSGARDGD